MTSFGNESLRIAVAGEPLILIDNIAGTLGSASLDAC